MNAISPALIGPGFMWTRQNELHAASGSPYFSTDPDQVAKNKVNGYVYANQCRLHFFVLFRKLVCFVCISRLSFWITFIYGYFFVMLCRILSFVPRDDFLKYRVPMKRLGSIMEVIQSVAFLLSDDASYTTATNLVIDGGMSGGLKA